MNECSILWCGKYHQNWENELHCHNYFQMVGILSGSGTVYVDDQPYEIEKEQVFLLCPQQLHAIHCGEKNAAPLKMLDVKFTVADPALFEDLVRVGDMFHLQDFGWFVRFFDKIIAESAQQRPYYYSIISGYLLEMLVRIVRERLGQPAAAPEEEAPRVVWPAAFSRAIAECNGLRASSAGDCKMNGAQPPSCETVVQTSDVKIGIERCLQASLTRFSIPIFPPPERLW